MVLSLHGLEGNAGIVETTTETSKLILNAITKNTYLTNTELAANNSHRNSRTSATAGAVYLPQASTEGGAAGYNRGRAPRHRGQTRLPVRRVSPQKRPSAKLRAAFVEMGELEHFLQTPPDIFVMHFYSVYISTQKYLKLHKNGVFLGYDFTVPHFLWR